MVHGWPWELQLQFCRALLAPAGGRTEQLAVVAACTARARGSPRRDGSFPRTRAWQNKKSHENGFSRGRKEGRGPIGGAAEKRKYAQQDRRDSQRGKIGEALRELLDFYFFFSLKKVLGV